MEGLGPRFVLAYVSKFDGIKQSIKAHAMITQVILNITHAETTYLHDYEPDGNAGDDCPHVDVVVIW